MIDYNIFIQTTPTDVIALSHYNKPSLTTDQISLLSKYLQFAFSHSEIIIYDFEEFSL